MVDKEHTLPKVQTYIEYNVSKNSLTIEISQKALESIKKHLEVLGGHLQVKLKAPKATSPVVLSLYASNGKNHKLATHATPKEVA